MVYADASPLQIEQKCNISTLQRGRQPSWEARADPKMETGRSRRQVWVRNRMILRNSPKGGITEPEVGNLLTGHLWIRPLVKIALAMLKQAHPRSSTNNGWGPKSHGGTEGRNAGAPFAEIVISIFGLTFIVSYLRM